MTSLNIAIIGGGLTGLSAAIRAAEQGHQVELFEAAPELGGRTRSFFHAPSHTWIDNGPHLLIGAYERTIQLLKDVDALQNTTWQDALKLPLWDKKRSHFALETSAYLPFPLALILAVSKMPEHGIGMIPSLLKMALSMKKEQKGTVLEWFEKENIKKELQRDMLEVLCLGAMNEPMHCANAASFSYVLSQAFANHKTARLGWFKQPLSQALIAPLQQHCQNLGVKIHTSCRVLSLQAQADSCQIISRSSSSSRQTFDRVILATAPSVRNQLFDIKQDIESSPICNIHLWFKEKVTLSSPFIGGIGTYGQWFFDISHQFNENNHKNTQLSHLCAVISADQSHQSKQDKVTTVLAELQEITGIKTLKPVYQQVITVHAATHLVRPKEHISLPQCIIDACEQPVESELPATIETAVLRGEQAIEQLLNH